MKQQPSHRVGRAPAIVGDLGETRVALLGDVLGERVEQVAKRLQGQGVLPNDSCEVSEQGVLDRIAALDEPKARAVAV